ncbi:MAG: hypothetical protein IPP43_02980 [Chitinophagaceae bacterium]|nr:hypothetical protein [Chitinophagaceae bacterium]
MIEVREPARAYGKKNTRWKNTCDGRKNHCKKNEYYRGEIFLMLEQEPGILLMQKT